MLLLRAVSATQTPRQLKAIASLRWLSSFYQRGQTGDFGELQRALDKAAVQLAKLKKLSLA